MFSQKRIAILLAAVLICTRQQLVNADPVLCEGNPANCNGCAGFYINGQARRCESSADCCVWDTPELKMVQSCNADKVCACVSPGQTCSSGLCCDGSICDGQCPPAAKFHSCYTASTPNCQSGLTCTVDSISTSIFAGEAYGMQTAGRCL